MKKLILAVALLVATGLSAKPKRQEYKFAPEQVYQAIYKVARREGLISFADEKNLTLSFKTNETWAASFDCSASVESSNVGAVLILNLTNHGSDSGWPGSKTTNKLFKKVQDELDGSRQ